MAICCALVSRHRVFSSYNGVILIAPPKKINRRFYKCDNRFHVENVLDMYSNGISYGIALISSKEYQFYQLNVSGTHKELKLLDSDSVQLQNRHKSGGQSAVRFERIREEKELMYIRKVAEKLLKTYLTNNNTKCNVSQLIIAGPGDAKKNVINESLFDMLRPYLSKVINTSEINNGTIHRICTENQSIFVTIENKKTIDTLNEINEVISTNSDQIIFGIDEIMENMSNLQKIIITDKVTEETKKMLEQKKNSKCDIVLILSCQENIYGDFIGIKFY